MVLLQLKQPLVTYLIFYSHFYQVIVQIRNFGSLSKLMLKLCEDSKIVLVNWDYLLRKKKYKSKFCLYNVGRQLHRRFLTGGDNSR